MIKGSPEEVASEHTADPDSKSKSKLLHSTAGLSDDEVVELVDSGRVSQYKLERELKHSVLAGQQPDCERAVRVRRRWLEGQLVPHGTGVGETTGPLATCPGDNSRVLPFADFDFDSFYRQVLGTNCENVVGYVPIPVGFVGPLLVNGEPQHVPLATTEGALVASTNRGCRALTESGGVVSTIFEDGMTRAPVFRLPSANEAAAVKRWTATAANFAKLKAAFESTTRFGKLTEIKASVAGRNLFLRFRCLTGDAMGMNMISKGVMKAVGVLEAEFPELEMLAVSGNVCTDKKPSAMNWIEGRGKSVVAEATLTGRVVIDVLKCSVQSLVELNAAKNLVGSAVAGSIGGNNAHAANVVTPAEAPQRVHARRC